MSHTMVSGDTDSQLFFPELLLLLMLSLLLRLRGRSVRPMPRLTQRLIPTISPMDFTIPMCTLHLLLSLSSRLLRSRPQQLSLMLTLTTFHTLMDTTDTHTPMDMDGPMLSPSL